VVREIRALKSPNEGNFSEIGDQIDRMAGVTDPFDTSPLIDPRSPGQHDVTRFILVAKGLRSFEILAGDLFWAAARATAFY